MSRSISSDAPFNAPQQIISTAHASQEGLSKILKVLHDFVPADTQMEIQERCFQAVWHACEAKEWELVRKVQDALH